LEYQLIPTLYISGDFVDYFKISEDKVFFYLADVAGHGASSAFVTILLKTLITKMRRDLRRERDDALSTLPTFLKRLNREILDLNLGKHLTMLVGIVDKKKNELNYSIAGHLPLPILTTSSGTHYLTGRGMPIGLFAEAMYSQISIPLTKPFLLTLFSDGVLEILPYKTLAEKEQYLLDTINHPTLTLGDIIDKIQLGKIKKAPDDIAVMTLRGVA
jgi:sigma-B regulation protein RsbU (phosphoserine phosphatase)